MDADYYLETIKVVFQQFSLVNGTWDVRGVDGKIERVRPQDIETTALFSVEGELDDISGSGQTEAVHAICSGVPVARQKHLEAKGAGHYGIFSGRRWRDVVYPEVKSFILSHQTKPLVSAINAAPTPVAAPAKANRSAPASVNPAVKRVPAQRPAAKAVSKAVPKAFPKAVKKK